MQPDAYLGMCKAKLGQNGTMRHIQLEGTLRLYAQFLSDDRRRTRTLSSSCTSILLEVKRNPNRLPRSLPGLNGSELTSAKAPRLTTRRLGPGLVVKHLSGNIQRDRNEVVELDAPNWQCCPSCGWSKSGSRLLPFTRHVSIPGAPHNLHVSRDTIAIRIGASWPKKHVLLKQKSKAVARQSLET